MREAGYGYIPGIDSLGRKQMATQQSSATPITLGRKLQSQLLSAPDDFDDHIPLPTEPKLAELCEFYT